jgi:UDPglucose--hexose-1-phosphate uridylyltransferase
VLPRHHGTFPDLTEHECEGLADILGRLARRYDNLFAFAFPLLDGFPPATTIGAEHPEWHLHGHYYPPLLRSATVRKFVVGYELLARPQRDITPESAARRLRTCRNSDSHGPRSIQLPLTPHPVIVGQLARHDAGNDRVCC